MDTYEKLVDVFMNERGYSDSCEVVPVIKAILRSVAVVLDDGYYEVKCECAESDRIDTDEEKESAYPMMWYALQDLWNEYCDLFQIIEDTEEIMQSHISMLDDTPEMADLRGRLRDLGIKTPIRK